MPRSGRRVALRFVGTDVILTDTYGPDGKGGEIQLQSYRFKRAS